MLAIWAICGMYLLWRGFKTLGQILWDALGVVKWVGRMLWSIAHAPLLTMN